MSVWISKKPTTIEAFLWTGDINQTEDPEWVVDALKDHRIRVANPATPGIKLIVDNRHVASRGDYIVKDPKGGLHVCKPDVFTATYETAEPVQVRNADLERRVHELEAERLRFFHTDGTVEVLSSPEEVKERRVACAKLISDLREALHDEYSSLTPPDDAPCQANLMRQGDQCKCSKCRYNRYRALTGRT